MHSSEHFLLVDQPLSYKKHSAHFYPSVLLKAPYSERTQHQVGSDLHRVKRELVLPLVFDVLGPICVGQLFSFLYLHPAIDSEITYDSKL